MLSVKDGIVRACVIVIFAHLVRLIICLTLLRTGVDLVSPLGASVLTTSHFIACTIYVGVKCVRMSV